MRRTARRLVHGLGVLCALAGPLAGAQAPGAAPAGGSQAIVIELKGVLHASAVPRIREALERADRDRYPAGAILLIDSPGGDGFAAMEIGRLARAARTHAFVRGRCASACVFVLAGSVMRSAPDYAVGIHRPRLTRAVPGVGAVPVEPGKDETAAQMLELGNRRVQEYLQEMGMPETLYPAMMAVPSERMRTLSREELKSFGLLGFDAEYAAQRGATAAKRLNVPGEEFARRALDTQTRCVDVAPAQTAGEFARCYRRTLEAP